MRVIEVARFGGPEVLVPVEVPDPRPGPGEVVIDVAVADTLWVETMIRQGRGAPYFPVRPPYRPGVGVAGTVAVVGAGVDAGLVGRLVVSRTGEHGGYVERALVPAGGLIDVPDGVSARNAAALLHDGTTGAGLVDLVGVVAGERVLVTAAGGGLGAVLVQLAAAAGGRVVAAARGAGKLARLRELGAEVTVDYADPDWARRVRDAVGGVEVVFDGAGGDYGRAAYGLVIDGGGSRHTVRPAARSPCRTRPTRTGAASPWSGSGTCGSLRSGPGGTRSGRWPRRRRVGSGRWWGRRSRWSGWPRRTRPSRAAR
ncbi:hypothetical protein GCM10027605_53360 [Micromonospora zhanjiangensis]